MTKTHTSPVSTGDTGIQVTKAKSGWTALSVLCLPVGSARKLRITTSKGLYGGLETTATGVTSQPGGIFTWDIYGDFSQTLKTSQGRCTEKAVREQHATVMLDTNALVARAIAFYVAKDAKTKAQADKHETCVTA